MEEKKSDLRTWVIAHKKQLLFAGISVSVVLGIILGLNNREAIDELWTTLERKIQKAPPKMQRTESTYCVPTNKLKMNTITHGYTRPQNPVNVGAHVRTMAVGMHHSAEKESEALSLGITLLPNQTLVDSYTKYVA